MTARDRRYLAPLLLASLLVSAGCGDDEPVLTTCVQACISDDGTLVTCGTDYDFAALSDALQARPALVALLGLSEVNTCEEAELASRAFD